MSNEPLSERIQQLEHQVRRWRQISLLLALLLICALAVAATLTALPATQEHGDFWLWLPWVRAARERAALEAEAVLRAEEEVRARKAADVARKAAEAKSATERNDREGRAGDDVRKQP